MTMQYQNQTWLGKKVIIGQTSINPSKPVNVLIGFHGAESTPENMLIHGNRLQLTNTVTIYPEGPVDAGNGVWSWWLDGPRQKEAVQQFLDFTAGMVDETHRFMKKQSVANGFHTCLWGFSQGGAASLVYALMGKHPVHKVASICGFLPELPEVTTQNGATQILGIFGANDDVVPSFLAEHALDEMQSRGHTLTAKETPQGHEVSAENIQDLIRFFEA
ncbi:alpha/beta hydrolase [Nitrospina gracilis]|uniref:alpha/beta hydrolase n=1 Tax=Nitrospina gracilis TaxID=35801 RepID=UPI001F20B706|nr:phospholipase [Nitrospina gracilis]MCF8720878.1 putative esterase [Nitrospina gracilis Nb-211]